MSAPPPGFVPEKAPDGFVPEGASSSKPPDGFVPQPAVPSARDQYVKAAGQLIGHATLAAQHAALHPVSGILEGAGQEISEAAQKADAGALSGMTDKLGLPDPEAAAKKAGYKADIVDIAANPLLHSRDIVDRLTKAAHAAAIAYGIKPTQEEKVENPTIARLGITRPLRAFQTLIDKSLPEVQALEPWFALKEKPLTDKIDYVLNRYKKQGHLEESAIAPVETSTKPIPKFNLAMRAVAETVNQITYGAAKGAEAMLNPVDFLEAEGAGQAIGAAGSAAMRGISEVAARTAPEMALRAQLSPVASIGEDARARLAKPPKEWTMMDHVHAHVQGVTNAILEGVQDKAGASPEVMARAAKELDAAGYEKVFRRFNNIGPGNRVPSEGLRALLAKSAEASVDSGSRLLPYDAKAVAQELHPRPIPTSPQDIAAEVGSAGVLNKDGAQVAKSYPSLYAAATGAQVPQSAMPHLNALIEDLTKRGIKPAPVIDMLKEGVATGKASFIALQKVDTAIHKAALQEQGAHPQTIQRNMADAYTAAQRPGEALVVSLMEQEAQKKAVLARAQATQEVWDEARRVVDEAEAADKAKKAPAESVKATEPTEAAPTQEPVLPSRAEALAHAEGAGVPMEVAAEIHRAEALKAQEAGTLDPEIAQEYADAGDTSFDPAALEEQSRPFPDTGKHPADMTWEEFQAEYPGVDKSVHNDIIRDAKDKEVEAKEQAHAASLKEQGVSAQPVMDYLREHPISEKAIKAMGLSGEFRDLKGRGIVTKKGGSNVDDALTGLRQHLRDQGLENLLPENPTPNDMLDLLDHESRKGTRAEAQAALVKDEPAGGEGKGSSPEVPGDTGGKPRESASQPLANPADPEALKVVQNSLGVPSLESSIRQDPRFVKAINEAGHAFVRIAKEMGAEPSKENWQKIWNYGHEEPKVIRDELRKNFKTATEMEADERFAKASRIANDFLAIRKIAFIAKDPGQFDFWLPKEGGDSVVKDSPSRDLIVQHNVTAENILHVEKMGGMAAPSLAITKADHPLEGFGEITILGHPDILSGAKVYGADIYSPRYPEVQYKISNEAFSALQNRLQPYLEKIGGSKYLDSDELARHGAEYLEKEAGAMAAFLEEKGISWKPKKSEGKASDWMTRSHIRDLIDKKGLRPEFQKFAAKMFDDLKATERIFKGFTNAGNKSYYHHTLENVVRELKKNLRAGESFNYGVGSLRAEVAPQFRGIAKIRAEKGRLVTKEDFQKVKEQVESEFFGISNALQPYYKHEAQPFQFSDTVMAVLADAAKKGFPYAFKEYGFDNVPEDVQKSMADYLDKLRGLPTEYFEAKLPRAVGLHEFSAAVAPEGTSQKVIDALKGKGLDVYFYKKDDIADRKRAISEAAQKGSLLFDAPQNLSVRFGSKSYPVKSVAEAADRWNKMRDMAMQQGGPGSSETPNPLITDDAGNVLGHISWNGRVWRGKPGGPLVPWSEPEPSPSPEKMAQLEMDLGPVMGPQFAKTGLIEYKGMAAEKKDEIAAIVAAARKEGIEHLHFIAENAKGKRLAHFDIAGKVNQVQISAEQKKALAEFHQRFGGTEAGVKWRSVHNHVTGNPTPSTPDHKFHKEMVALFDGAYEETLVTDGKQFAVIDKDGLRFEDFNKPLPTYYEPKGAPVESPRQIVATAAKDAMMGKSYVVLFKDARNHVISVEHFGVDENIPAKVKEGIVRNKASNADIVSPKSRYRGGDLPEEVGLIVHVDERGNIRGATDEAPRGESAYGPQTGTMVASFVSDGEKAPVPRYMGAQGMDEADFKAAIEAAKIQPGSEVTARVKMEGIAKGEKGKVLTIGQTSQTLLVKFPGEMVPVSVRPENLVETFRKPGARVALEAAQKAAKVSGEPSMSIKKIIQEQQAGLSTQQADELALLSEKFKNQAKGARIGAREATKAVKAKMEARIDEFRDKVAKLKDDLKFTKAEAEANARWLAAEQDAIRGEIVNYLNATLPPEARGKFLTTVKNADTVEKMLFARQAIDDAASQIYKKGLLADIRKMVPRVLDSPRVDVNAKKAIREYLQDVELKGRSAATYERLRKTLQFVVGQEASGVDIEMPRAVIEELDILGRRPLKDMNEAELEGIFLRLQMLEEIGRTTVKAREALYLMERERVNAEILADLKRMDQTTMFAGIPNKMGFKTVQQQGFKPLPASQRINNSLTENIQSAYDKYLAITPPDVVLDMLSKTPQYQGAMVKHFAHGIGADYSRNIDIYDPAIKEAREIIEKHDLSDEQVARVTAHAYLQQPDGIQYLKNQLLLSDADIESVKNLKAPEAELYAAWRKHLDGIYPQLSDAVRFNDNIEVGHRINYFPVRFDPNRAIESDDDLAKMIRGLHQGFQKNVAMKNIQRREGSEKAIALNGQRTFESYMRVAAYKVAMSRRVRMLGEIVNSPEFQQAAGDFGGRFAKQFVTMLARRGAPRASQTIPWIDNARRNASVFAIVGRLPTALVHMTLLTNAASISGPGPIFGAFRDVLAEDASRKSTIEDWWRKNDPVYRQNHGDDPVFQDAADIAHWDSKEWWKALATPTSLRWIVQKATLATLEGNYKAALAKRGLIRDFTTEPNQDALNEAKLLTRRAIPSPELPHMFLAYNSGDVLTGNLSLNRAATQFKNFTIDRWSTYVHDLTGMLKSKRYGDALRFTFWQTISDFVEVGIRHGYKLALAAALGAGAADEMDEDHRKFWGELFAKILEKPPFVPDIINMAMYGYVPTAAGSLVYESFTKAGASYKAYKLAENRKALQNITESLVDLASLKFPIPFGGVIEQVMRMTTSDGGVRFPYEDERERLNNLNKDGRATQDELQRRAMLNHIYNRFEKLDVGYKSALKDGRHDDAAQILDAMKNLAHEAKQ